MSTEVFKSPNKPDDYGTKVSVFLAGSIEENKAEMWQDKVASGLKSFEGGNFNIFNPRRDDYVTDAKQDINNDYFVEQVEWELLHLDIVDVVVVYIDPNTTSPITLLELGRMSAMKPESLIVCCPDGFYRKGNVDVLCNLYHITQVDTIDELIAATAAKLSKKSDIKERFLRKLEKHA